MSRTLTAPSQGAKLAPSEPVAVSARMRIGSRFRSHGNPAAFKGFGVPRFAMEIHSETRRKETIL